MSAPTNWQRGSQGKSLPLKIGLMAGGLIVVIVLEMVFIAQRSNRMAGQTTNPSQSLNLQAASSAGFKRAEPGVPLVFPQDFGPHPDYQTEWWYYTGNLRNESGQSFGYQLTFFRRGLLPPSQWVNRASDWATDQVYLAHFAITDGTDDQHLAFERFSRGAAGLAGVQAQPFQAWLEDWSVTETSPGIYRLHASAIVPNGSPLMIDLGLIDSKGPVLEGNQGYSQKGPDPGEASYYYSMTHLISNGSLTTQGKTFSVTGSSWMDHEYSTSALAADQVGWDWFSIQLDNDEELMVFQIRRQDGSVDPYSSGLLVRADGSTQAFSQADFQIRVKDTWRSPHSKGIYPSRWQVTIPSLSLDLDITPAIADQEMNLSFIYWEGAVQIKGTIDAKVISGVGYVELTGYAASITGQF